MGCTAVQEMLMQVWCIAAVRTCYIWCSRILGILSAVSVIIHDDMNILWKMNWL